MTTPVASGPGALSRRTDTGPTQKLRDLPDADYGENATYKDLQQGAGLAQSNPMAGMPSGGGGGGAAGVISMGAPSTMPGTPVTDGAAMGSGMGPEAMGLVPHEEQDLDGMLKYLPVYEYMANLPNASWATRNLVRKLKARV